MKKTNILNEREQTAIATNNQEQSKIGSPYALLNRGDKDNISGKGDKTRSHDVAASVSSTIAM